MVIRHLIFGLAMLAATRCSQVSVTENRILEQRNRDLLRRAADSELEVKRLEKMVTHNRGATPFTQEALREEPKVSVEILRPERVTQEVVEDSSPGGTLLATSIHEELTWYYQGLAEVGSGKYDQAARSFSEFLVRSPDHVYADRAQYWVGEAYFRAGENGLSLVADNVFMQRYPSSFRFPEVMYRAALTHLRMGRRGAAEEVLREVLRDNPTGSVSKLATKKLLEILRSKRG